MKKVNKKQTATTTDNAGVSFNPLLSAGGISQEELNKCRREYRSPNLTDEECIKIILADRRWDAGKIAKVISKALNPACR